MGVQGTVIPTFTFGGNFLGYVNADASGNISQSLDVGQGIPHGTYTVNATDSGISVGLALLLLEALFVKKGVKQKVPGKQSA